MTNEEAIKTLEANYPDACFEQLREAVDAAIEALKAQDADSDTISRKAAIDALDKRFDSIPMEQTTEILLLRKDLRELPSAQPEKRTDKCTETHGVCLDTIDRQVAIDALTRKMVSIPTAGEKDLMGDVNRIRAEDISVIKRLPSAPLKIGHKINQHQYPAKWICSECGAKHFDFSDKFCSKCGANVTDEEEQPEHKCDTCKYEKSLWFNRCADCSDYELWEAKE